MTLVNFDLEFKNICDTILFSNQTVIDYAKGIFDQSIRLQFKYGWNIWMWRELSVKSLREILFGTADFGNN